MTKTPNASPASAVTRWPIQVNQHVCALCNAYSWEITDEALLVNYLARLAVGQALAVARVLRALDPSLSAAPAETAIDAAIKRLEPPTNDQRRYRRDGWVFQMIAWLASWRNATGNDRVRAPQIRPAEHGVDGLILRLTDDATSVNSVTISEEKATDKPRKTITEKVWPEVGEYERGERDDQLVAEVAALLAQENPATASQVASAIHWHGNRWYRVAITVAKAPKFSQLFKGYNKQVSGARDKRRGEVLHVTNLRTWMDTICAKMIVDLRSLKSQLVPAMPTVTATMAQSANVQGGPASTTSPASSVSSAASTPAPKATPKGSANV